MQLSLCVCPRQGNRLAITKTLAYYATEFITAVKNYDTGPVMIRLPENVPR
jgi:hypothetical protein